MDFFKYLLIDCERYVSWLDVVIVKELTISCHFSFAYLNEIEIEGSIILVFVEFSLSV